MYHSLVLGWWQVCSQRPSVFVLYALHHLMDCLMQTLVYPDSVVYCGMAYNSFNIQI